MTDQEFNETLYRFYDEHGRHDLAWRQPAADGTFDPYKIVVSELMLQQTQVARVAVKFNEFLTSFPTVADLASAELSDVLKVWSGLGYNRRAKFLWQTAQAVMQQGGEFPNNLEGLVEFPGIGKNTAGAVLAYAYNIPQPYIETNVRTVFIHHFFNGETEVLDAQIMEKLSQTLDHEHPREYYWALMDYGTFIKKTAGNLNRVSSSYKKQSTFEGSKRQVRGEVLRQLANASASLTELAVIIPDARLEEVITDLLNENLIRRTGNKLLL